MSFHISKYLPPKHFSFPSTFRRLIKGTSVLLTVFLFLNLAAQNERKALEKKRKQKEKEIELTKKLLAQTSNQKKKTLNELRLLNKQIRIREELIGVVNNEIGDINLQILQKQDEIQRLSDELELRKKEYGDMIYIAYRTRNVYGQIGFYLSASSFHQAIKRINYIRQLSLSRTRQLDKIIETQKDIIAHLDRLKEIRGDKTNLLTKKEQEKNNLVEDKNEQNQIVQTLQGKEKELKADLAKKQKAAKELDDQIKAIIAKEIARKTTPVKGKTGENTLTPEAKTLSASFMSNKGKLPWPVPNGFIIRGFGEHPHPTLKGIVTVNNGIDIVTTDGVNARAVFEGEVRAIFSVPNMQNAIMINHGEFFTVYTHIENVMVKKGDKVTTKQAIGTVFKDTEDNKTILHFEMWQGTTKMDPESWIHN